MSTIRQMFHHDGVTDLKKLREEARAFVKGGEERVVIHLHPYFDKYDGCKALKYMRSLPSRNHEVVE